LSIANSSEDEKWENSDWLTGGSGLTRNAEHFKSLDLSLRSSTFTFTFFQPGYFLFLAAPFDRNALHSWSVTRNL